ncbi:Glycosyltransferase involved in cell wall bisynthesis [Fulvimarina manganoxydans]|uniref:Glycosyltransferase involved in cell wall bisynthesis n=1 Tax=Fulvimarina manganoxydans TaxID=937218 RepID=A0A1W2DH60_9HYPH|nr:Glycosyltransferase involved in cell wall bisynthesis [Fulvimarina manganoxydans]
MREALADPLVEQASGERVRIVRASPFTPALLCLFAFVCLSLLFLAFPSLDLAISRLFFKPGQGFSVADVAKLQLAREVGTTITAMAVGFALLALGLGALAGRRLPLIPRPRDALFVIGVYAFGPALIVNAFFKDVFGRARPREVIEFGGWLDFSPVWTVHGGCFGNCSFVSGEASSAIALVAIVWLFPKALRLSVAVAVMTMAVVLSLNRIAMGGHFLSDVLLSWCITLGVIFALRPFFTGRRGAALDAFVFRWAGNAQTKPAQDMAVQDIGFSAAAAGPAEQRAGAAPANRHFDLVSVVVPARNEADNLAILVEEIGAALTGRPHETIVVDDGSSDHTGEVLAKLAAKGLPVRHMRHDCSCGQSRAVRTGVFAARGDVVATIDGDGQNDPAFIPVLVEALESAGAEAGLAAGQRVGRTDTKLKQLSSRFANGLRRAMLADDTRDTGCGLKVVPTELFRRLPFFDGWHRYLPALVLREGYGVVHRDVRDRSRRFGTSNYGIFDRAARGALDLFGVWWLIRRGRKVPDVSENPLPQREPVTELPEALAQAKGRVSA